MASSPSRSSRVLGFPSGSFYIQSSVAGLVLDVERGFLKDPTKAGARIELTHRKSSKNSSDSTVIEQQLWKHEEGYITNVNTGVARAGSRVIQSVRKSGKDVASQHWLNEDGVLTLASNTKFVIAIDGDATRDGTKITIQEKKAYNDKQKWTYLGSGSSSPSSPSPSKAESISIRPDNFPSSWFYIKSKASGLVVDIEHGYFTDPMKAGARAEMNHQKIDLGDGRHSLLELQLWRYDAGFLINRRTGFVLDIQGGMFAPSNLPQELFNGNASLARQDARNQHWFFENGFIANVYNSRLVLDIDGDGSKDGAKIAIGERKAAANTDQLWVLEEVKFQWLAAPSAPITEEIVLRDAPVPAEQSATTNVLPTDGWFYIKSLSSGHVIDVDQGVLSDPMSSNVLVNMNHQITDGDKTKIESQLWRYDNGQLINRRSGFVLDCKQGVVRYGARLMQGFRKEGKEAHHQRWESVNGTLIIQGKPTFAIDIEGDGTKAGARLSLQRPKSQNNLDQQWAFQLATFDWLQTGHPITKTFSKKTVTSTKVVSIRKDDWFFIKSSATGLVMDLEAGWLTSPTDVGAYISMKKQRNVEDPDKTLLERQLWRYEDGYVINCKTGYVIDIYGHNAVVGAKLVQERKALTEEDGRYNQLWNIADGNMQLLHSPNLIINLESNKDGSRVKLVEHKATSTSTTVKTWTLEVAHASWLRSSRTTIHSASYDEGLEEAQITHYSEFPTEELFYIKSKASNLVLDIEHGFFRDHTKPGAFLELNNQKLYASAKKHALLELQLWRFEDGYIINRRTGLVLDATQGASKPGTRLIQWTRKTEEKASQQWGVSNGFIHLKSQPNFVLDVDGDGSRDGARISLNERKDKKNLDQRWSFEAVRFTWLEPDCPVSTNESDVELLKEYETTHLARVVDHVVPPVNCWFYLKSGISDLVIEPEHGRGVNHLKSGTHMCLAHQKLKSGKHSHALLELQLWRFQDGYIINRRSGLVLAVDKIEANASLIQSTKSNAQTQRWVIENGVLRLASNKEFAIFLSYGRQGSRAFIRHVRHGELLQSWAFSEVHFSWLTLERSDSEQVEEEQLDVLNENEVTYLKKEKAELYELNTFSKNAYFFIRTISGEVIDIEHGIGKNHMKVGAYASVHPQTTAASANQHALLDIQLWTLKDGYLINKRTGLALTFESDAKDGARLIQALPKNAIKWSIEDGYIFPEQHSHLALNIREGRVVLVERTTAITWTIYQITLSWLIFTEVILLEAEKAEDIEFYEEFEEVVLRSSTIANEVVEYIKVEQHLVAPKETWFYLLAGNKVASISSSYLLEHGAEGASIELVAQKRFASADRHALLDLQLWKLEGSYLINRFTGLYLTIDTNGSLTLSKKLSDVSRQQWQFSEEGALSLVSNTNQVVDFINDKAVLVERSSSKTVWLYETVTLSWVTTLETSDSYDVKQIEREVTEYRTVYTRYVKYITIHTITTITTTRTRRIVRVHSQSPIQSATVMEKDGTTWACHLVEAGTNVDYEMQLLLDNTTSEYYIYVQWGSTQGQLEGPYKSFEVATKEFQEIFSTKVGIEWSERETTGSSNEQWNAVEFEYDTIEIKGERSEEPVQKKTLTRSASTSFYALVDQVCPIADQVAIYKDSDIYHTVLTQRSTGVIYITQILYNTVTNTYYVYLRHGESEYTLDGPYESADIAKTHFKTKYADTFGITWEERNTTINTHWAIVHQTFETQDEYEDILSEEDDQDHAEAFATAVASKKSKSIKAVEGGEQITIVKTVGTVVEDQATNKNASITKTTSSTLAVTKPAVAQKTSWFRKLAGAGAGVTALGALTKINGIWKRSTKVITTLKTPVDQVCPIAKTSYVYYTDKDVYDSVLVEKSTGVTYVIQLIYNSETHVYYVYTRWGETDYKLDGPHETIDAAKDAFQVTYKEKFDVEWTQRETTVSERWIYETKVYETYEITEDIEEDVDEAEIEVVENVAINEGVEKKVVVPTSTDIIAKPAVSKESSWFRKITSKAAGGAKTAADGALKMIDGVWRRSVPVITTRKADVDKVCPIAKTSY
ncbi:hypothetical protein BGX27_000276, partial [Mortierella sp. AM989]